MALETLAVNRQQVAYLNETVAANQDVPQTLGGAAGAYNVIRAAGCASVLGIIKSAVAPAAGFPRIRFWPAPGDVTVLTAQATFVLTVDPNNSNTWLIDFPLFSPYFTIEYTQGAAPGNVYMEAWVLPEGSGGSSSFSPPPSPPSPGTSVKAAVSFAAAGDNTVIAASGTTTIRILHYTLLSAGGTSLTFKDGAAAYSGAIPLVATQGLAFDAPGGIYPITLTAGNAWVINNLNAISITGFVLYTQS